jgi:autotransporter passenger strand-loop-strand repeat protein
VDGVALVTTIASGGLQVVDAGGQAGVTAVLGQQLLLGGAAIITAISGAGTQMLEGGTAISTTIAGSGRQDLTSGATAVSTTISGGGRQELFDAAASNTTIRAGGEQGVFGGGTAITTTVSSGGGQFVNGGTAISTLVKAGGTELLNNAGTISNCVILSGGVLELVNNVAVPAGVTLSLGAILALGTFEALTSNTISSGHPVEVLSGGTDIRATVSSGGILLVESGGTGSATTILAGGTERVLSGGTEIGHTLSSGGHLIVSKGGVLELVGSDTLSGVTLLSGATVEVGSGYTLSKFAVGHGFSEIILSGGSSVIGSGTANSGTITVRDGAELALSGTVVNAGRINLDKGSPSNDGTTLVIIDKVTLTGGGTIALSSNGDNEITTDSFSATLTNVNNTIIGAGTIDVDSVINKGTIEAANGELFFAPNGGFSNSGTLAATASSILDIFAVGTNTKTIAALGKGAVVVLEEGEVVNSGAGTILASGSGAEVDVVGAEISGGTLKTVGAAKIVTSNGFIHSATIAGGSVVEIAGSDLQVLEFSKIGAAATVEVQSGGVLVFDENTIGSGAVIETGSGSVLELRGAVNSGGTLFASGAGSRIVVSGSVSGGITRIGDGTVEFTGSSGENVAFVAKGSGGLVLDGLGNAYKGKVSGFGVGASAHADHNEFIDFTGINISGASFTYTPANAANTSGTLTVTDGTHSASVVLVGNYTSTNFSSTDDGHGHVKITDPGAAMPQSANIALFGHYIAGSFAGGGIHGGTVITAAETAPLPPLLAHPHTG